MHISERSIQADLDLCKIEVNLSNECKYPRWWVKVNVQRVSVKAFFDPGVPRTVMGSIGRKILDEKRVPIQRYNGPGARVANGSVSPILEKVEFLFKLGGLCRTMKVLIKEDFDADCLLGADFIREFNATLHPSKNLVFIGLGRGNRRSVACELACIEPLEDDTAESGLNGLSDLQKVQLQQLLALLLPKDPSKFGYCSLVEHEINVGSFRAVKKRYYLVAPAILAEMHKQVKKLLAHDIIEKSTIGWSSPVVMIRKYDGSYHLRVDYRQISPTRRLSFIKNRLYPLKVT